MLPEAVVEPRPRRNVRARAAAAIAAAAALLALSSACLLSIAPLEEQAAPDADSAMSQDGVSDAGDGGCDGHCLPVLLFKALGSEPWGIYVSGQDVIFVTRFNGQVVDLAQTAFIDHDLSGPVAIVGAGSSSLWWTMSGSVTGGDSPQDAAAAGLGTLQNGRPSHPNVSQLGVPLGTAPFDIRILDGGDLAWTSSGDGGVGAVYRTDSMLSKTAVMSKIAISYNYLSTDGSHVWATAGHEGAVYRIDSDADGKSTSEVMLYANDAAPGPTDWRAGKLYVAAYAGGYVGVVDDPLASTPQSLRLIVSPGSMLPPTPLQPDGGFAADGIFDLKTDDEYVYWTNKNDDSIVRAPLDGGSPEAIVYLPEAGPSKLFITDDAIYFTALGNGSVYRVAK